LRARVNLVRNGSFERWPASTLPHGATNKYGGDDAERFDFVSANAGKQRTHSVMNPFDAGVRLGWVARMKCEPNTDYILPGGSIKKTERFEKVGRAGKGHALIFTFTK